MIARFCVTALVRVLVAIGRAADPGNLQQWRDRLWAVATLATLENAEERDWMAAFLLAHVWVKYGGADAEEQLEKLYHRMHFGTFEETTA